jgi:hypothetical protein
MLFIYSSPMVSVTTFLFFCTGSPFIRVVSSNKHTFFCRTVESRRNEVTCPFHHKQEFKNQLGSW